MVRIIEDHIEYPEYTIVEWVDLCEKCSTHFLYLHEDQINWIAASFNKNLTLNLIKRHELEVDLYSIFAWCGQDIINEYLEDYNQWLLLLEESSDEL